MPVGVVRWRYLWVVVRRGGWVSLVAVVILVEGQGLPVEVHGILGLVVLVLVCVCIAW